MGQRQKAEITSRLTMAERYDLESLIDTMLIRHRMASVCPLSPEELASLWRANMNHTDKTFWEAARAKLSAEGDIPLLTPTAQGVLLKFDFAKLLLQISDTTFKVGQIPFWDRHKDMTFINPEEVLSPGALKAFREWAMRTVHIWKRAELTSETLKRIVNISSTVGQINRMAPELVKYTNILSQQALRQQERRSPIPAAWMDLNRTNVRASLDHLAFCYLLPSADGWFHHMPWVWDRSTSRQALYQTKPRNGMEEKLSTYHLPSDPNPMELGTFEHA